MPTSTDLFETQEQHVQSVVEQQTPPAGQDSLFEGATPTAAPTGTPETGVLPGAGQDAAPLFPSTGQTYTAPEITPDETVAGQLDKVLNKGGPLMEYAAGQGMQYANSRGLLNSDIGAEAAQQAVFGAALPIAQQDAQTYANRHGRAFEGTIQSGLQAQGHVESMVQLAKQGDINSRLQLEQFGYNMELSVQDNLHRLEQLALQGDINSRLALEQFGYDVDLMAQDHGYRLDRMDAELQNALTLGGATHDWNMEEITLAHENNLEAIAANGGVAMQQNYLTAVERRTGMLSAEITQIYTTQGLTPEQQAHAIAVARRNYENDIAMLGRLYSSSPGWDSEWEVDTGTDNYTPPGGTPDNPDNPDLPPPGPYGPPFEPPDATDNQS